jgi:transcriptional regulator with XRE-family HTH domain
MTPNQNSFETVLLFVIRARRRQLKVTQKQVAYRLCMSNANYSKYENCKYPVTIETVRAISDLLKTSLPQLIDVTEFLLKNYGASYSAQSEILELVFAKNTEGVKPLGRF